MLTGQAHAFSVELISYTVNPNNDNVFLETAYLSLAVAVATSAKYAIRVTRDYVCMPSGKSCIIFCFVNTLYKKNP